MKRLLILSIGLLALFAVSCGGGAGFTDTNALNAPAKVVAAGGDEVIYLSEIANPGLGSSRPETEILQVQWDDADGWFTLTHVGYLTGFYSSHIAITADGSTIYGIDNGGGGYATDKHLCAYDIGSDTTTDLGTTNVGGMVQLAFNPDGVLYAASGSTNHLYTIDYTASPLSSGVVDLGAIARNAGGNIDISGADLAFDSDGNCFVLTGGSYPGLYSVDLDTMTADELWTNNGGASFTGLAVRYDGTGDLIASNTTDDSFAVFDASNSYTPTYYDMRNPDGTEYAHYWGDMTSLPAPLCEPYVTDLIAGQNMNVGTVTVSHEDGQLVVTYDITDPDWCITATHLDVETSVDDIPQKNGNPIPGHFQYNDTWDCETTVTYTMDWDEAWCDLSDLYIAAHAIVTNQPYCDSQEHLYLSENNGTDDSSLFSVTYDDVNNWFDLTNIGAFSGYKRCHIAVSPDGADIYGINNGPNGELVKYNIASGVTTLVGNTNINGFVQLAFSPSGTLIAGSGSTNKYYEITVDPAFSVTEIGSLIGGPGISGGDIVFDENGNVFMVTNANGGGLYSVDLGAKTATQIWSKPSTDSLTGIAVRYDGSGNLIVSEHNHNQFLVFDESGTLLDTYAMKNPDGTGYSHTAGDLGSVPAPYCEVDTETAWGFGPDFPGKNWATYIDWTPCCED